MMHTSDVFSGQMTSARLMSTPSGNVPPRQLLMSSHAAFFHYMGFHVSYLRMRRQSPRCQERHISLLTTIVVVRGSKKTGGANGQSSSDQAD